MSFFTDIPHLFHSEYEGEPFSKCAVCSRDLLAPDAIYTVSKTCNHGEAIMELAVCSDCAEDVRNEVSEESRLAIENFIEAKLLDRLPEPADLPVLLAEFEVDELDAEDSDTAESESAEADAAVEQSDRDDAVEVSDAESVESEDEADEEEVEEIVLPLEDLQRVFTALSEAQETPSDPLNLIESCFLCGKARSDCRTFHINAYCRGEQILVRPMQSILPGTPSMVCDDCNLELSELLSEKTRKMWDRFYDEVIDTPPRISLDGPVVSFGV